MCGTLCLVMCSTSMKNATMVTLVSKTNRRPYSEELIHLESSRTIYLRRDMKWTSLILHHSLVRWAAVSYSARARWLSNRNCTCNRWFIYCCSSKFAIPRNYSYGIGSISKIIAARNYSMIKHKSSTMIFYSLRQQYSNCD